MVKEIVEVIASSVKNYFKNPLIILPFFLILLIQIILAPLFAKINYSIINSGAFVHYSALSMYALIFLIILSLFLSGAISLAFSSLGKKASFKDFLYGIRFFHKNFVLIALNLLIYFILVRYIAIPFSSYMGGLLSLEVNLAKLLFLVVYILLIMSTLTFLSFSSFILISERTSIISSIKKSIIFVKSNYISTVSILLIFFLISQLIISLREMALFSVVSLLEIIDFCIIYPMLALIFSAFYNLKKHKK